MKKARDYRSKYSGSNGSSSNAMSRGRKNAEHYKLSDVGNDKSAFGPPPKSRAGSEEHMLHHSSNSIVKSVTYTVQVDDDTSDSISDRRRRDRGCNV